MARASLFVGGQPLHGVDDNVAVGAGGIDSDRRTAAIEEELSRRLDGPSAGSGRRSTSTVVSPSAWRTVTLAPGRDCHRPGSVYRSLNLHRQNQSDYTWPDHARAALPRLPVAHPGQFRSSVYFSEPQRLPTVHGCTSEEILILPADELTSANRSATACLPRLAGAWRKLIGADVQLRGGEAAYLKRVFVAQGCHPATRGPAPRRWACDCR